jgi:hypothetical protein
MPKSDPELLRRINKTAQKMLRKYNVILTDDAKDQVYKNVRKFSKNKEYYGALKKVFLEKWIDQYVQREGLKNNRVESIQVRRWVEVNCTSNSDFCPTRRR